VFWWLEEELIPSLYPAIITPGIAVQVG